MSSLLPWWVNLLLAVIAFAILNQVANIEIQPTNAMDQIGQFVSKQMIITFAIFGKILVPFVFIIGAIASAVKQRKRKTLYDSVAYPKSNKNELKKTAPIDPIDKMSWQDFEILVSAFFKKQGYSVSECGAGGPDGGVDLRLTKGSKNIIVQCKHWKTFKVGVKIVREQLGIKTAEGADSVIIVTSGRYTDEAIEFARNQRITLIDGMKLKSIITQGKSYLSTEEPNLIKSKSSPYCPQCSSIMVERIAKKGKWAGNSFWGCSRFPKCKGIIRKQRNG